MELSGCCSHQDFTKFLNKGKVHIGGFSWIPYHLRRWRRIPASTTHKDCNAPSQDLHHVWVSFLTLEVKIYCSVIILFLVICGSNASLNNWRPDAGVRLHTHSKLTSGERNRGKVFYATNWYKGSWKIFFFKHEDELCSDSFPLISFSFVSAAGWSKLRSTL